MSSRGIKQGQVRHRFVLALDAIAHARPKYARYAKLFRAMIGNWNVLIEVEQAEWAGREVNAEFA